jgi:hypothetical protein
MAPPCLTEERGLAATQSISEWANRQIEKAEETINWLKDREQKANDEARKAIEAAAELRGKLELLMTLPSPTKTRKSPEKRNERKSV